MEAVAHSAAFAKKVGIPQKVGKDFAEADKGKKFKGGGMAKKLFGGKETYSEELKEAKSLKSGKISGKDFVKGEKSEGHKDEENPSLLAKEIKSGSMSPEQYASVESKEKKMKKGGMCGGGMTKKYASGGKVSQLAKSNGCAVKGKTKGKII